MHPDQYIEKNHHQGKGDQDQQEIDGDGENPILSVDFRRSGLFNVRCDLFLRLKFFLNEPHSGVTFPEGLLPVGGTFHHLPAPCSRI